MQVPPPQQPENRARPEGGVEHALRAVREQLDLLHRTVVADPAAALHRTGAVQHTPGWQQPHAGEHRWPASLAVAAAIALQVALPGREEFGPFYVLPALEVVLGVGLLAVNPGRINRSSNVLRSASVVLIALISLDNGWASYRLIRGIISGAASPHAGQLLSTGASIYLTNIIVFALWFWEWDRGGPAARANAERKYPDFLFPQMTQHGVARDDWRPSFADYLYVSYTNATAFSPTDAMPLSLWAKLLMLLQSAVALTTIGLVVARAVSVLPSAPALR